MSTKLTLNLNKEIIEEAKSYAKNHQTSLSVSLRRTASCCASLYELKLRDEKDEY